MKNIKSLFVFAFVLMLVLPIQAQVDYPWFDAGPSKTVLLRPDSSQTVQIGKADNGDGVCYEWSGPNILSDPHKPVITVNPRSLVNKYTVIRHSYCGTEQSEVEVLLRDSIGIVSVTPKYDCYYNGDTVEIWGFNIVTDPPGCETLVKVAPKRVFNVLQTGNHEYGEESLTFSLTFNNKTCVYPDPNGYPLVVRVYNDNLAPKEESLKELDNVVGFGDDNSLASFILQINKFLKYIKENGPDFLNFFEEESSFSKNVSLTFGLVKMQEYRTCCNKHIQDALQVDLGSAAVNVSFGGDVPLFPGVLSFPGVAGTHLHANLALEVKKTAFSFVKKGKCSEKAVSKWRLNGSGEIGVGVFIIDPRIAKAEGYLRVGSEVEYKMTGGPELSSWLWTCYAGYRYALFNFDVLSDELRLFEFDVITGKRYLFDD